MKTVSYTHLDVYKRQKRTVTLITFSEPEVEKEHPPMNKRIISIVVVKAGQAV